MKGILQIQFIVNYLNIMSKLALDTILDEYRAQRKYRQTKRNDYLRRFQTLKQGFSHIHHHHPTHNHQQENHHHQREHTEPRQYVTATIVLPEKPQAVHIHHHSQQIPVQNHQHHEGHLHALNIENRGFSEELLDLQRENQDLKRNLSSIENQQREKLQTFKSEIEQVRAKYIEEIKKLTDNAKTTKEQIDAKIQKITTQNEMASKKNIDIEKLNKSLKTQLLEGNQLMGQYVTEIKKQYGQKIGEFEKIFNSSNEKIELMEKEFNQDQFIENTLKNEELLKSIEQNASKADQAGKILEDYGDLLNGKKEILTEINSNVEMKEKEIEKMVELQGKMKVMMDKLTSDKKIYVAENNKMAQELLEIKNLLVGVMNQSQ